MEIAAALLALLLFTSPQSDLTPPVGLIVQQTYMNKDVTLPITLGSKTGQACITSYLGLVSQGDASIKTAAASAPNGGITKISAVDYKNNNLGGFIIMETCTIVYGE
jgi:hypothetical protein